MKINTKTIRKGLGTRLATLTVIICIALLPSSCYKDKGSSPGDYTELAELRIDTAGLDIRASYSLLQSEDLLEIAPDIYYKGDRITGENAENYPLDFAWVLYSTGSNTRIDTLSNTTSVSSMINRGAGTYTCLFTVTDTQTRIQDYCSFNITVMSNITDGYLVLYENQAGDSDVGLIINDWINPTTVADRAMIDIYSGTNGEALPGKPVNIRQSERTITSAEVLIATETSYVGVSFDQFDVTYPTADLFNAYPGSLYISYMGIGGNPGWSGTTHVREYLISGNELYYTEKGTTYMARPQHTKLGDAMNGNYGELAPWCAMLLATGTFEAVVYDQTNTCFRQVASGGVEIVPFETQTDNPQFDITNTGMEMIASDWGFKTYMPSLSSMADYYEFSLMKKGDNRSLLVSYWGTANQSRASAHYNLNGYPGIEDASMVAAGSAGPILYYSDGRAIHRVIHNVPGRTIEPATDFWTPPAGEEITRIVMHKNASQMLAHPMIAANWFTKDNEVLYVATWNEADQTGSVYQILVDPTNGQRISEDGKVVQERVYSGFGKIKDMCWKWPRFVM